MCIRDRVILTGKRELIEQELSKYEYPGEKIQIVHTSEVIETAEPPVMAIRKKKDSYIVVGMQMAVSYTHLNCFRRLADFRKESVLRMCP